MSSLKSNIENMLINLLAKQEEMILIKAKTELLSSKCNSSFTQEDIDLINSNLLLTDRNNIAYRVHEEVINSLIYTYISFCFSKEKDMLSLIFKVENSIKVKEKDILNIPDIIEELHIAFLNSIFLLSDGKIIREKSKHYLKEKGAIYTSKGLAKKIVEKTINNSICNNINPKEITCLDFASGTGRFYFEAVKILKGKYNLSLQQIICNNIFAIDVDKVAISILQCKVISLFSSLNFEVISALSSNIISRNALIPKNDLFSEYRNSIDLDNDFKKVFSQGGFDAVFSNPPYYLLKVNNRGKAHNNIKEFQQKLKVKIKNEVSFFRNSGFYKHSIEGMLNYYQLSIEMILYLTKKNGQIGVICPSSIFGDLTSKKLRKHILTKHKLYIINYYPEAAKLFESISQSTVIFFIQKNEETTNIRVKIPNHQFEIDFKSIKSIFPINFEIPLIDKVGWSILLKISRNKKVKEIPFIRNRRGELDLTLHKEFITTKNTGWRLVRGNMLSEDGIVNKNSEFVKIEEFLNKKSSDFKNYDYNKTRLTCQQISNIDLQKRLRFVFCKETDILGNSCNYIVSTRENEDLKKLFFILNSQLINWRFKITSSNNHINNYELGDLPIIDLDKVEICNLLNNKEICKLYGLTESETNYILKKSEKV